MFEWLATSCAGPQNITFHINGGEPIVAEGDSGTCSCGGVVQRFGLQQSEFLSRLRRGANTFEVQFPGSLAWAVVRVFGAESEQEVVIFDAGGGGDAQARNPDLCLAGSDSGGQPIAAMATLAFGEQCDDGNAAAGDGCSAVCATEACGNSAQTDGTCHPTRGCINPPVPDGSACSDGTSCTAGDACLGGECAGVVTQACFAAQVTPIDPTVPTAVGASTAFLYAGTDAVQKGVAAGTIDPVRAAVIRGQVKTRDGGVLTAVKVRIAGHPEFGETRTREDGMYDLAVNGGGQLTVVYERPGYLPVERPAHVPCQEWVVMPDVVMTALDPNVTMVQMGAPDFQVARGSVVTDEDGTRQATVLIPPGTTAEMECASVPNEALSSLSVRATEYTVGAQGPAAMPAPLPPNSGYTYAVELSADEALSAGCDRVTFSEPVLLYGVVAK